MMHRRTRCFFLLGWTLALGLLALPGRAAPAAADTLRLKASNDGPSNRYFAYCLDPCARPPTGQRAAALWAAGRFRNVPPGRVLQTGFTQDRLWLRATVVNTLPQRTRFVWSVYTATDSAVLYVQDVQAGGRGAVRRTAGVDGRVVAARRGFPARFGCLPFWLDAHSQAVVYLRVEGHSGAWYLPTDLTTTEDFLAFEQSFFTGQHWAWLLGLYLGSALLNGVLYVFLRDRIHLWYGAYVLFTTWFLLAEDGLDAWLLPPWAFGLGAYIGQFSLLLLALACGLRILTLFVHLRAGWPRLHRLSRALSLAAVGYALAYALAVNGPLPPGSSTLAWLNGGREVLLWGLLAGGAGLLGVVALRGRPVQRRLARLYGLTYSFFFFGTFNFLLNRTGLTNLHVLDPNSLAWGLAVELVLLSVLLTGRFRLALRQNNALRLRRLHERAAASERLILAQDEEREALARELHDALAPGLTALHLAWQGRHVREALAHGPPLLAQTHRTAEALLRQLRHDVRDLSHVLLPPAPGQQLPLPAALALLTETFGLAGGGPRISSHCDPAVAHLPAALHRAAYRIVAELLHNALRHAQAHHIRVALTCAAQVLTIVVTDDGQGFDPAQPTPAAPPLRGGLGLRGVQARAGYLRGRATVASRPGQGTVVTVELPVSG